jgi:hypothetical protein
MKKLFLLSLLFLLPRHVQAQQLQLTSPDCEFSFQYEVVSNVINAQAQPLAGTRVPMALVTPVIAGYDNRNKSCTTWTITYQTAGVTAISLELDGAPDAAGYPGAWSTWTVPAQGTVFPIVTAGAGATGQATAFNFEPWVSIILNSSTGTGTVTGHVIGWRPQAGQDSTAIGLTVSPVSTDPCESSAIVKLSASISSASATTVQLVAPTAGKAAFVCGASFTIAPSATSADTAQFITGTGATCGGSTVTKTGTFGNGDLTTTVGVASIKLSTPGTVFSSAVASGVCIVTAGTTVSVQGILTYVIQ